MTQPMQITREFVEALPKTDLHVHLDGSLRLSTLIELAREANVELPAWTEEGLMETVYKERYESLVDYLQGFDYTVAVMQTASALERVAYEFAVDNQAEGVRYVEVRFAPQMHVNAELSIEDVLLSVNRGLKRAQDEFNASDAVTTDGEPAFHYGIIACAMRFFPKGLSEYFDDILRVHQYSTPERVFALASLELAQAVVKVRNEHDLPITGFDLAGAENGFPAEVHAEAFEYAHKNFLHKTVHAGEAYGPESIFQAITDCNADRIGHGLYLFRPDMVQAETTADKDQYVHDLSQFVADRRITVEVCLTSNLQTNPAIDTLADHPLRKMLEARLSAVLCTDNRLVSRTTVTDEIMLAVEHLGLGLEDLKRLTIHGFKRSFYPGTYMDKRTYVRQVMNHYEKVAARFGLSTKNVGTTSAP